MFLEPYRGFWLFQVGRVIFTLRNLCTVGIRALGEGFVMILTKKDLIEAVGKKIGFSFGLEKGDKKVVKRIGLYLASKGLRLPDVRLKHLYEYQGLMY